MTKVFFLCYLIYIFRDGPLELFSERSPLTGLWRRHQNPWVSKNLGYMGLFLAARLSLSPSVLVGTREASRARLFAVSDESGLVGQRVQIFEACDATWSAAEPEKKMALSEKFSGSYEKKAKIYSNPCHFSLLDDSIWKEVWKIFSMFDKLLSN